MSRTRGSLLMIGARAIGSILGLLAIPIYAKLLGDRQFGAAVFVQYLVPFFLLLDFGFQEAAQRQITQLHAKGEEDAQWLVHRVHKWVCFWTAGLMVVGSVACGFWITITDSGLTRADTMLLFVQLGALMALTMLYQPMLSLIVAFERFEAFAKINAVAGLVGTVASVALAYVWRSANAIILGTLVTQAIQYVAGARATRRITEERANAPAWDRAAFGSFSKVAFQDYPNRLLSVLAQNGDKLLFSSQDGVAPLALYRKASRAPDALAEMLMMMNGAIFPGWNRDYSTNRERFNDSVGRILSLVLFASGVVLIVPMGFAVPLLQIYLRDQFRPDLAWVCAFVGVYQAFQVYYTALGYALHVAGRRFVIIPLTALNAAITLFATLPVYYRYGLEGVGAMNAIISVLQLPIAVYLLKHSGLPHANIRKHLVQATLVLVLLLAMFGVSWLVAQAPIFARYPSLGLFAAPVLMLVAVYVGHFVKAIDLPHPVKRRLRLPV